LHPPKQSDVIDLDPAFGQDLLQVAVGQTEAQIPAHRQQDHLSWEPVAGEGRSRELDQAAGSATLHPDSLAAATGQRNRAVEVRAQSVLLQLLDGKALVIPAGDNVTVKRSRSTACHVGTPAESWRASIQTPCHRSHDESLYVIRASYGGLGARSLGSVTRADDDPDREQDSRSTKALASPPETPTRLHEATAGMAEGPAWRAQQIANGWRNLVNALRRHKEIDGVGAL
jgi:hypothetical protein